MMKRLWLALAASSLALCVGCTHPTGDRKARSSGAGAGAPAGPTTGAGPGSTGAGPSATGSTGAGGMPNDPQSNCPTGKLCLTPPAHGFQLQDVGDAIQPGEDVEYCEVVPLPGDPSQAYYVNELEVAMTTFSHHLIVAAAIPGSATEMAMSPGEKQPCFSPDAYGGDIYAVTGSQHPYHDESFPAGVGKKFTGGQLLVFDYHYFNSSGSPVQAKAAVNFHTVDGSQVQKLAHAFGFYNFAIDIPPNSQKSFQQQCAFDQDIMVSKLTRHTHKWGTDFAVYYAGGAHDGQHIWTTPNYEDTDYVFEKPILVKQGEGFRYTCAFDNTTAHELRFGLHASDEMCILFGDWFVAADGESENDISCSQY